MRARTRKPSSILQALSSNYFWLTARFHRFGRLYWKNGYFDTITANNLWYGDWCDFESTDHGSTEVADVNEALSFNAIWFGQLLCNGMRARTNDQRYLSVNYPFNNTYTVDDTDWNGSQLYSGP